MPDKKPEIVSEQTGNHLKIPHICCVFKFFLSGCIWFSIIPIFSLYFPYKSLIHFWNINHRLFGNDTYIFYAVGDIWFNSFIDWLSSISGTVEFVSLSMESHQNSVLGVNLRLGETHDYFMYKCVGFLKIFVVEDRSWRFVVYR